MAWTRTSKETVKSRNIACTNLSDKRTRVRITRSKLNFSIRGCRRSRSRLDEPLGCRVLARLVLLDHHLSRLDDDADGIGPSEGDNSGHQDVGVENDPDHARVRLLLFFRSRLAAATA